MWCIYTLAPISIGRKIVDAKMINVCVKKYTNQTIFIFLLLFSVGVVLIALQLLGLQLPPLVNAIYLAFFVISQLLFLFIYGLYLTFSVMRNTENREQNLVVLIPGLDQLISRTSRFWLAIRFLVAVFVSGAALILVIPRFMDLILGIW